MAKIPNLSFTQDRTGQDSSDCFRPMVPLEFAAQPGGVEMHVLLAKTWCHQQGSPGGKSCLHRRNWPLAEP